MVIIGLTGGFGTGKSFVASIFKKLGAEVIDADRLAHGSLKKGAATYRKVVALFGRSILDTGGSIDRKSLGSIVFSDRKSLARLNKIVHPVVIGRIKDIIGRSKGDILVIDAPLICEAGLLGLIDMLVVVKASRQKQLDRCVKKFKLKKKAVSKRIACQLPLKTKISKADYVVDNNGTRKETVKKVTKIWKKIMKGARLWR